MSPGDIGPLAFRAAIVIGLGWAALVAILFLAQRQLLYQPDTSPPEPAPLQRAGFRALEATTADGLSLRFWFRPPATPGGLVVVHFQGNAGHLGHRLPLVRPVAEAGFGVALAGCRGYGGNPGAPSEQGLYADGRAVLDALAGLGFPPPRIALWGESLGSGVAVQLARERPVAGLLLQAPYVSVTERAAELYPWLPARTLVRDRFDNLAAIGEVRVPLLIVHGEADRVIPAAHGRRLLAAAPEPKRGLFVAGLDHNDPLPIDVVAAIVDFFRGLPKGGEAT
jgi:hypothetical protein